MMDIDSVRGRLLANGADIRKVFGECLSREQIGNYVRELERFLRSYDFMRLGQGINHGQWNAAQMRSAGMNRMAMKLGLVSWSRQLQGIRQAAAAKNGEEAKQLLALIISRRVKLMETLEQIRDENPELFETIESSDV